MPRSVAPADAGEPESEPGDARAEAPGDAALSPAGARRVAEARVESGADAELEVFAERFEGSPLCEGGEHLVVGLRRGDALVDQHRFEARCEGACTEEARRKGEESIAEIEEQIEAGEATASELDYDFTECIPLGQHLGEDLSETLGRAVFVVETDTLGPHGIPEREARLATAGCGAVQVSERFGNPHTMSPTRDYSKLRAVPGGAGEPWEEFVIELATPSTGDGPPRKPAVRASFDDEACTWKLDVLRD